MKKLLMIVCVAYLVMSAFVPHKPFISSIYGTIEPAEAAKKVWAINGKDSVSVVPEAGKFSIAVTAGDWKLVIEAEQPYKDAVIENVHVTEGRSTDAGVIKLIAK